jgi:anti-sigma regulatory factor (Ser/Thr protein kinase)
MASPEARADGGHEETSGPDGVALDQPFDRDGLYALRAAVAAHASHLGAVPERVAHLVIVASELASNAVRHGGGTGRLRLWLAGDRLWCEVSDTGTGIVNPETAGSTVPSALAAGGRGLWIVRRLSSEVRIESSRYRTTVTATLPLTRPIV